MPGYPASSFQNPRSPYVPKGNRPISPPSKVRVLTNLMEETTVQGDSEEDDSKSKAKYGR